MAAITMFNQTGFGYLEEVKRSFARNIIRRLLRNFLNQHPPVSSGEREMRLGMLKDAKVSSKLSMFDYISLRDALEVFDELSKQEQSEVINETIINSIDRDSGEIINVLKYNPMAILNYLVGRMNPEQAEHFERGMRGYLFSGQVKRKLAELGTWPTMMELRTPDASFDIIGYSEGLSNLEGVKQLTYRDGEIIEESAEIQEGVCVFECKLTSRNLSRKLHSQMENVLDEFSKIRSGKTRVEMINKQLLADEFKSNRDLLEHFRMVIQKSHGINYFVAISQTDGAVIDPEDIKQLDELGVKVLRFGIDIGFLDRIPKGWRKRGIQAFLNAMDAHSYFQWKYSQAGD